MPGPNGEEMGELPGSSPAEAPALKVTGEAEIVPEEVRVAVLPRSDSRRRVPYTGVVGDKVCFRVECSERPVC